jgi:methanogenic corrinoid protein MtbC1
MQQIGHGWAEGSVSVTKEHRATSVMLAALHGLQRMQKAPPESASSAFVAGLSGDPYLLAPLCADLVLREAGFRTVNYGPDTPPEDLVGDIRTQRPALVAVSYSIPDVGGARSRAALRAACQDAGSALVVGGRGMGAELVDELRATAWCRSMLELDRIARHLAATVARQDLARTA